MGKNSGFPSPDSNHSKEDNEQTVFDTEEQPSDDVLLSYSGRPPWYDSTGKLKQPYVVGLCGGSASGKTTVANNIINRINVPWVVILSLDSFYNVLTEEQHEASNRMEYDFDSPNALDFKLAVEVLRKMKEGKTVKIPIYDFVTHRRLLGKERVVYGANVIIVEGLMTFYCKELLDLLDLKIFVDTDSDLRLGRRIKRDMVERGRSLPSIMLQYKRFVKPNFDKFIAPLVDLADIVIPWNNYNFSAVDMVSQLIKITLSSRGFIFRSELISNTSENHEISHQVRLINQTNTVKVLQTRLRNRETERDSFVRNSQRLIKLCIVEALDLLYDDNTDPENCLSKKICSVSIIRAGEAFEDSLKNLLFDYNVGKILIQTSAETGEPEFHYLKLPRDIKDRTILLFDAAIASGAAAIMAIRILVDHEVNEKDIIMVTLILTPVGVQAIHNAFPNVRFVTAIIDKQVNKNYYIIPGMGNFGKRYFGL